MLVASILAGFLWRIGSLNRICSVRLWAVAFAGVGLAAGLGGTCHGFVNWMPGGMVFRLWNAMLYTITVASFTMLLGAIVASSRGSMRVWLLTGAGIKAGLVWVTLLQSPHFQVVALDYEIGRAHV